MLQVEGLRVLRVLGLLPHQQRCDLERRLPRLATIVSSQSGDPRTIIVPPASLLVAARLREIPRKRACHVANPFRSKGSRNTMNSSNSLYNSVTRWIRIVRSDGIKLTNGHNARVTRHSHVYQRSAVQLQTPTLLPSLPLLSASSFFLHHNWPQPRSTFNVPLADSSSLSCLVLVSANPLASLPLELVPGQTPAATTVHPRAPSATDWPRYHFTDSTNGINLSSPTLFVGTAMESFTWNNTTRCSSDQ